MAEDEGTKSPTNLNFMERFNVYPKSLWFWAGFVGGIYIPFWSVIFQSKGLSPSQIGILIALNPFIGFVGRYSIVTLPAAPLGTGIADKLNRHTLTMVLCMLIG